jgi:hypothetical protein
MNTFKFSINTFTRLFVAMCLFNLTEIGIFTMFDPSASVVFFAIINSVWCNFIFCFYFYQDSKYHKL